ncbi:hypothetical protein MCOR02_004737 [Pyricularia oryzae]|nr:hypothetical protein MCOR02_004737 [Pyricularia oryzae]KAI6305543.1 hypothetical protein MCOR34_008513 [Pyricularia oryzae]KAI6461938.1 hypothetical protein MCOR17_006099 [Pyricularia oryzae]KAI6499619.1 hypothetical protein MCOR13_006272 [Pyricularia oryzae]KAI6581477.1 hypothetical protein MCOR04_005496 [Pyricularia oryzae]
MPAATNDGPTVALSFANNFWGKEDAGVGPLFERMHGAKQTCDELRSFYNARASIEEEYSRKLLSLSRKPLGSQEMGSLKNSLDTVRGELESMGKQHQSNAAQMRSELEEPLAAFAGAMKERRKIVQNSIEKLLKLKIQQTQHVNKTRDKYEQECLKIKGYLAQGHMVMGQEERKNKAKLEKTQISLATSNTEYENAVKVLEDTTARWNREWKGAADKFQDLEEERLDFTKSSLWTFANIASTVCVSDDASCEKIRLSLEKLDVEKDIMTFIGERGTGQEIPDPPKYINFCRGDVDSQSEASDDDNYSVAQFPRSINPAYRSSSPQPSTFESHHDPNSALARELAHREPGTPTSREQTVTPQKIPQKVSQPVSTQAERQTRQIKQQPPPEQKYDPNEFAPAPVERHARQIKQQPPPEHKYDPNEFAPAPVERHARQIKQQPPPEQNYDPNEFAPVPVERHARQIKQQQPPEQKYDPNEFAPVPHDPYPMDGMTMLCRTKPGGSDLGSQVDSQLGSQIGSHMGSQVSSVRPSSRDGDGHSDYSNPTSMSSIEPPSGKTSPVKQEPPASDRGVMKKKSGFFQHHSPFRRKSNKEAQQLPSFRNTWHSSQAPASRGHSTYGGGAVESPMTSNPRSPSPDPIDANASLALNVGQNVFAVSTPSRLQKEAAAAPAPEDDPIALALAELKGVTGGVGKVSSVRMSADRYHGIATPAPGTQPPVSRSVANTRANDAVSSGMRGTPPPSYDQQVQRLGVPAAAVTSRAMKETSQKFVTQTRSMFNQPPPQSSSGTYASPSRPGTRGADMPRTASPAHNPRAASPAQMPRTASPAPMRSTSPRPPTISDQQRSYRSASPNPYTASERQQHQRTGSYTPTRTQQHRGSDQGYYQRQNSPRADMARSASPAPFRGEYSSRPNSSHVQQADMSVQLAPVPDDGYAGSQYGGSQYGGSQYGGSQRGRNGRPGTATGSRGLNLYEGAGPVQRTRSKSVADTSRQYTRDGRPILHFARASYMYQAAIPEELGFAKGDVLAVLRHQDDGWWEAEVHGGDGQVGLVPSNYLQVC